MAGGKNRVYERVSILYDNSAGGVMPNNGLSFFLLGALLLGVVFLLQWVWRRPLSKDATLDEIPEPGESVVTAKTLMTPEEATLFNLIKLAAQDYLLVFVKLPILQVVSVADKDEEARKTLLRTIQPARLDMVLAHPGTLQTTMVVKFQKDKQDPQRTEKRDQVVDTVLKAAGIKVVVLQLNQTYSVEHLTALLGLAEDE